MHNELHILPTSDESGSMVGKQLSLCVIIRTLALLEMFRGARMNGANAPTFTALPVPVVLGVEQRLCPFTTVTGRSRVVYTSDSNPLSGVPEYTLSFKRLAGAKIWNKPVVESTRLPVETTLCGLLKPAYCDGAAWAYSDPYFTDSLPATPNRIRISRELEELRRRIAVRHGVSAGLWDVWAWRGSQVLFIEVKKGSERFKDNQIDWLQAALREGMPPRAFVVLRYRLT